MTLVSGDCDCDSYYYFFVFVFFSGVYLDKTRSAK
jgi:hypothetical protein